MMKPRHYLKLAGTALVDVFLLWMGWYLLFRDKQLTSNGLFLAGVGAVLGVVFVLSAAVPKKVQTAGYLSVVAIYFFLRAWGILEAHFLSVVIALGAWAAAALLSYIVTIRMNPDKDRVEVHSRPP